MAKQDKGSTKAGAAEAPPADQAATDGQDQVAGSTPAEADLGAAASDAVEQVQTSAGHLADEVKQLAATRVNEQQHRLASGIGLTAKLLRAAGEQLREEDRPAVARYIEGAADRVQQFAGTLREQDASQLVQQTEEVARRRPGLFLGGGLALGFLGTRFLQSSAKRQEEVERQAAERQAAKRRREAEKQEQQRRQEAEKQEAQRRQETGRQAAVLPGGDAQPVGPPDAFPTGAIPPDVETTLPPTYPDAPGIDPVGLAAGGFPVIPDAVVVEMVEVDWEIGAAPPPDDAPGRQE